MSELHDYVTEHDDTQETESKTRAKRDVWDAVLYVVLCYAVATSILWTDGVINGPAC